MLLILNELAYTFWPYLAWFAILPLFVTFWFLDLVVRAADIFTPFFGKGLSLLGFSLNGLFYAFIFSLSFAFALFTLFEFSMRFIMKIRKKTFEISFYRGSLIFGILWMLVIAIGRIVIPSLMDADYYSEVIGSLYLGSFVFGLVSMLRYVIISCLDWMRAFYKVKHLSNKFVVVQRIILLLLASYPFLAFIGVIAWFFYDSNPGASQFHVLHAAIKNTCLIDPERINCPQTLEELSYIEPKRFSEAKNFAQMQYQYDVDTNQYSLVIRYNPQRAVVFDQRFIDEYGVDFREYTVQVLGQDRLKNPPTWSGPWTFLDWEYVREVR